MPWFLYLIECADGSIYTGIATDVDARFEKHSSGKGARYTRSRKPVRVLASFELAGRSEASRAEYWVKRLSAAEKRALIAGALTLDAVVPNAGDGSGSRPRRLTDASGRAHRKRNPRKPYTKGRDVAGPKASKHARPFFLPARTRCEPLTSCSSRRLR